MEKDEGDIVGVGRRVVLGIAKGLGRGVGLTAEMKDMVGTRMDTMGGCDDRLFSDEGGGAETARSDLKLTDAGVAGGDVTVHDRGHVFPDDRLPGAIQGERRLAAAGGDHEQREG